MCMSVVCSVIFLFEVDIMQKIKKYAIMLLNGGAKCRTKW